MLPRIFPLSRSLRVPISALPTTIRSLSSTPQLQKWTGSQPSDHVNNEPDKHNVRHDAAQEGKKERSHSLGQSDAGNKAGASRGTSEKSGGSAEKAKEEFPEAPDTIGMQDERGQKE